jgi:hypothetical protein
VERRSGPLWIALAASLKLFPVLLVLVYAGRRQWLRMAAGVLLTGLLWAPALLYDLSSYPTQPGEAGALASIPLLYFAVAGLAIGATLALAATRYGWLAGATAVTLALPRLLVYDATYVMLGMLGVRTARGR